MKGPFSFLAHPLVLAVASDMLNWAASEISEMRCAAVKLGHWLIKQREAQRPFDVVASRHEAGPLVLTTRFGLQETADHP